jgi:hypothetical protein
VQRPTPASELGLRLDPTGVPYDAPVSAGETTSVRPLATLHIPDGDLRVMDGNDLQVLPSDGTAVTFDGVDELAVSIVWDKNDNRESVLGVRVDRPGAARVAHWGRFRSAYRTDGGVGGVTSGAVVARAKGLGIDDWDEPDIDSGKEVYVLDLDGEPGDDSVIFSNGFGDGSFPMSEGRDAAGRLVSLMIWHTRYPWRLAVPDGTPPPDVHERELELQACIAGLRPIQVNGTYKTCT